MKKILVSLLALSGSSAFAWDYTQFQAFDNQVSVGYGLQQQATSPQGNKSSGNNTATSNLVQLEGERLLNNGIWINVDAQMVFGQGSTTLNNLAVQEPVQSNYGVNGKVGYAFPLANQHLLVTPYALLGLNNNGISGDYPTTEAATTANQYYYSMGAGGRLEYRINNAIELYADQSAVYNWDQSTYGLGVPPQNLSTFTSTLGAKFNVTKDFQIGAKGFYQFDYTEAGSTYADGTKYPQAQNGVGGLVTFGLTY